MKKLLTSLVLVAAMLCSMGGLVYADETDGLQPAAETEVHEWQAQFVPGTVPAESSVMDGVIPPVNALVLSMLEHDMTYDESCDIFLWNSLYYMISMYGQMDDRAQLTDDQLILPRETVEDYAAALFTNYSGLPQLPAELIDRVTYDQENDSYSLARGDAGLTELNIQTVNRLGDGLVEVSGALVALEDGSQVCGYTAQLSANNSMFGYSISGMVVE